MKLCKLWIVLILASVILTACNTPDGKTGIDIIVYKTPTCGCCVGWSSYMDQEGYNLQTVMVDDLSEVKARHNIPPEMESCHTAEVNGYFIEGHVPNDVIKRMLIEKPDIDGLALPRMPSGSPGMPGPKREDWIIYALKDGKYEVYETI